MTKLAVQRGASKKTALSLQKVNLSSPQSMAKFADVLKQFIIENGLVSVIKDKNYVNVEGWQFAGACLGIFPVVESVERVETDTSEIKYIARVKLVKYPGDKVVGSGIAICSSKEQKRSTNDEYVIASMAQTRATGKAFRNMLAWVMKLAGYESLPSEEATYEVIPEDEPIKPLVPIDEVKAKVSAAIMTMSSTDKMKFLKNVGKLNEKGLTESQYRQLYFVLEDEAKDDKNNS